jgi:hypothetical protein
MAEAPGEDVPRDAEAIRGMMASMVRRRGRCEGARTAATRPPARAPPLTARRSPPAARRPPPRPSTQGVPAAEPGVVDQLLAFAYRYSSEVLQEAEVRARASFSGEGFVWAAAAGEWTRSATARRPAR